MFLLPKATSDMVGHLTQAVAKPFVNTAVNILNPVSNYNKVLDSITGLDYTSGRIIEAGRNWGNEHLNPAMNSLLAGVTDDSDSKKQTRDYYPSSHSAYDVAENYIEPQTVDYLNADLAKHYGLGAATAYQEALSNTAYQRAVKDMKAAGLNPAAIFGSGKGYTAGGVQFIEPQRTESSFTSARSFGGSSSGSSDKNFLPTGVYHAINTAAGLATVAITKKPSDYFLGETVSKAVLGLMNVFSK